jgi:hypothetical protein
MTAPVIPPSPTREEYAEQYAAALAANADETVFDRAEPIGLFVDWLTPTPWPWPRSTPTARRTAGWSC